VAVAGLGCGRIREVKGCRALARTVNPVLDDISARIAKDKSPPAYRHAATRYAKLSADLKHFDVGIPRTEKTIDELVGAMTNASTHSAKLAEALEKRDLVNAASARRELAQLARVQKSIAARIDDDCVGN
jgi:predicted ribosome quality control (RQC) complex YloA/Tae2 family protein